MVLEVHLMPIEKRAAPVTEPLVLKQPRTDDVVRRVRDAHGVLTSMRDGVAAAQGEDPVDVAHAIGLAAAGVDAPNAERARFLGTWHEAAAVPHDVAPRPRVPDRGHGGGADPKDGDDLVSSLEVDDDRAVPALSSSVRERGAGLQVRQMLRYQKHDDFEEYYQDILEQVKAEVKSVAQPAMGAFSASGRPNPGGSNSGDTGAPRGLGSNPCFNCGSMQHTRDKCPKDKVKCTHCGGGHLSSLCPRGPGGALRDSLSQYAKRELPDLWAVARSARRAAEAKGWPVLLGTLRSRLGRVARSIAF